MHFSAKLTAFFKTGKLLGTYHHTELYLYKVNETKKQINRTKISNGIADNNKENKINNKNIISNGNNQTEVPTIHDG